MANSADTLFFGGNIITIDKNNPSVEALAVRDGRITALGTEQEVMDLEGLGTSLVDLKGRTLMPGFVEPHAHPFSYSRVWGDAMVNVRATHIPSYEAVLATIRRRAEKASDGELLAFVGLDALRHEGMCEPSLAELDAIAPNHPIAILTFNFHSLFVNSKLLELFDITDETPDPPGGRYERDQNGRATGKMIEFAAFENFNRVCQHFRKGTGFRGMLDGLSKFAEAGITTATDIGYHEGALQAYDQAQEHGPLPIRVRLYSRATVDGTTDRELGWGDDSVKLIGMKVWGDGSPFVGTAWLSRPYLNTDLTLKGLSLPRDYVGHMNYEQGQLNTIVARCIQQGWQIATHVQGDRTIDAVLDAYEAAMVKYDTGTRPYRLEHCGVMREDQIERAMQLGVVCSFFVPHVYHWGDPIRDALLGPERAANYMPVGAATRAGMRVSYHSDAPMTEPDPLLSIQVAVTRRTKGGNVLGADQRVGLDDALQATTINAAYQIGMEAEIGSLETGKRADFAILQSSPHDVAPEEIAAIKILGTWVDGREVWAAVE